MPATLGPIAYVRRKLLELAFWPSICETRAAIGTADTPAEPVSGFTLPSEIQHMSLPGKRPPTVLNMNAASPRR